MWMTDRKIQWYELLFCCMTIDYINYCTGNYFDRDCNTGNDCCATELLVCELVAAHAGRYLLKLRRVQPRQELLSAGGDPEPLLRGVLNSTFVRESFGHAPFLGNHTHLIAAKRGNNQKTW